MTDAMVSSREVPWLKLGKTVDGTLTASEAADQGGLNFDVEKRPLYFEPANAEDMHYEEQGGFIKIESRAAIVRVDTGEWLGIMGTEYPILQYREAFDFMEGAGNEFVAAGTLNGGRQGFMVVETPDSFVSGPAGDSHQLYTILRTSHDGTRAVEVSIQSLRHRCMNQLALNSFSKNVPLRWSVTHTSSMSAKMAQLKDTLSNIGAYRDRFQMIVERLAGTTVPEDKARQIITRVIPDYKKSKDENVTHILSLWKSDSPTVGYAGTGWGLVNAVSEFYEWGRPGGTPQSRFTAALNGQTYKAVNKTLSGVVQATSLSFA
jgi:phage/plasmid-like protein (TIGR03299 family)